MEREWIVSGRSGIGKLSLPDASWGLSAPMDRVSALCAQGGRIFCAGRNAICSVDACSLLPRQIFAAAPDVRALLLSPDGLRLYALCSGADSVLMLSAVTGEAQILCRAGVCPPSMALSEEGDLLFVAGGKRSGVLIYCARTLHLLQEIRMPGPVCALAVCGGILAALCMTDTLDTLLVCTDCRGEKRIQRKLCGFPGALAMQESTLLASVQERLYAVSVPELRVLCSLAAPGRASSLSTDGGTLMYLNQLDETLYLFRGGRFLALSGDVSDFAPLERIQPC